MNNYKIPCRGLASIFLLVCILTSCGPRPIPPRRGPAPPPPHPASDEEFERQLKACGRTCARAELAAHQPMTGDELDFIQQACVNCIGRALELPRESIEDLPRPPKGGR